MCIALFFACFMRRSKEDKQADEYLEECHDAHLGRDEEYLPFAEVRLHANELLDAFTFAGRLDIRRSSSKSARSIGAQRSHAATRAASQRYEDERDDPRSTDLLLRLGADQPVRLLAS